MASALLLAFCVLLTFPMVSGLKCYSCTGTDGVVDSNVGCIDGTGKMNEAVCPTPASGLSSKCSKIRTKVEALGFTETTVTRGCDPQLSNVKDTCSTTGPTTICYCSTDGCNGQTALTPGLLMCFVGLLCSVLISI